MNTLLDFIANQSPTKHFTWRKCSQPPPCICQTNRGRCFCHTKLIGIGRPLPSNFGVQLQILVRRMLQSHKYYMEIRAETLHHTNQAPARTALLIPVQCVRFQDTDQKKSPKWSLKKPPARGIRYMIMYTKNSPKKFQKSVYYPIRSALIL